MQTRKVSLAVLASTLGVILGSLGSSAVAMLGWLGWVVLGLMLRRCAVDATRIYRRIAIVATAWGCTMLGVWFCSGPGRDVVTVDVGRNGSLIVEQPGEPYPILIAAGFPWQGFEGNGNGAAPDRVPWDHGVDAWFVNLAAFLAVFWLLARVVRHQASRRAAQWACALCAICSFGGGWRIVWLFD